jgi:hypothetical protein
VRRRIAASVFFVASAIAARASATSEVGRGVADPNHEVRVGLEQEISGFDLPIAKGTRYTFAPRADWAPREGLSLRTRVPFHNLWLAGDDHRAGIGDAELRLKFRLYSHGGNRLVQGGAIQTMPTGSAVRGLGNGAVVLTPFLTGGIKIDKTILYAYVSDAITLRNQKARAYDDFTDPSTNHETRNVVGVITGPYGPIQGNLSLNAYTILTGGAVGETFVFGAAVFAFAPSDVFRVQAGLQLPVAGDERFDYKCTLDAYFFL